MFDESHWYKTKLSVGWHIAMNAKIGFKLQVTATPRFHSLYVWCDLKIWLFSGAPDDPEDETVMDMHGADALGSAVKSLTHAIWTEDRKAQEDVAHWMIQISNRWTMMRCSELKLVNRNPLVWIPQDNAHLIELKWTEDKQAKLKALVERYTSRGTWGAWRVHRWRLVCFSFVLGDKEYHNDVSHKWYSEWELDTQVDSPIYR
jgi:hypothetical protein